MEPILPKKIAWRVDKLGFEPPQKQWLDEPKVEELIEACKTKLVAEKVIERGVDADDWQCLMAAKLIEFAAA
jgi:asparagine synthase (glutamine-hydrolysing)